MELPGKSEYAAQQLSGSKSENNINPAVAGKSNDCRLLRAYTAAAEAQKNGDKKTDSHAVFKRLAETLITEEEAEFNYQEKLRNKNSEKVRKWRNKKKVTHQTEDETIARAQNEGEHLQHEKQALTERLCELNASIAEIQQKRTDSHYQRVRHRYVFVQHAANTFLVCLTLLLSLKSPISILKLILGLITMDCNQQQMNMF